MRDEFVDAARRGERAGFDMIELHCAHGYLLSAFISPTQNRRRDEYGGSLENRLRFPLEVFRAMRAVWPEHKPMSVRISAHDWAGDDNVTPKEAVEIARAFVEAGVDIIDVSSGQVTKAEKPVYGRMFQTPFSDRIRNELGVPTMAVGNIYEIDHVNSILAAGRADLCALARPHQMDPNWTLRAAAEQKHAEPPVPVQYQSGYRQLSINLERAGQMRDAGMTHAIVTGGGSGIGLAVAHRLRALGHEVTILGRSQAKLDAAGFRALHLRRRRPAPACAARWRRRVPRTSSSTQPASCAARRS